MVMRRSGPTVLCDVMLQKNVHLQGRRVSQTTKNKQDKDIPSSGLAYYSILKMAVRFPLNADELPEEYKTSHLRTWYSS
jgi:hypothetical protein